jgi:ATP-dependent Lon protease
MDPGEFRDRRIGFEDLNGDEPEDFQVNHHRIISRHDVALNTQPSLGEATALVVLQTRNGDIIGGDVQIIEVSALLGTTGLEINGAHDQSMKHSARAAYNYVREHARDLHLPPEAVRSRHISIHLLYVASQREGPSAGLAFVLGIISALSGYPLVPALAVTGEVSQHGKVTAVGGIPQKLAAAKAHGRKKVILPRDNEPEIQKLEDEIRDLEIICVDTVTDALNHALQPAGSRR